MKKIQSMILGMLLITTAFVTQAGYGSNSATFAPKTFTPSQQFSGTGLVGNYFKATDKTPGSATIHDPSGANSQSYVFTNVTEKNPQQGCVLIGSIQKEPKSSGNMKSHAMTQAIDLYGKQVTKKIK